MIRDILVKNQKININSYELEKLKTHFPYLFDKNGNFLENKFNDIFKFNESEINVESYGLNFLGKNYAQYQVSLDTETIIVPDNEHNQLEQNKNSKNLYIVGDNIDALKHLLMSYCGKIKCIYIDPPYNTGSNDFLYSDSFDFDDNSISERMGISLEEAQRILNIRGKNNHSAWLTFMYPRLVLARDLLSNDGVIFISIDDNEQANLKLLCDEIFGEHNFVGDFIRKTKSTTNNVKAGVNIQHENCLVYSKDKSKLDLLGENKNLSKYKNEDNDKNGAWISDNPTFKSLGKKNNYFPIENPYTGTVDYPPPGMCWRFSENTFKEYVKNNKICFKKDHKNGVRGFIYKRYLKDLQTTFKTFDSLVFTDNAYLNQVATKESKYLDFVEYFSFPKPTLFIKQILKHATYEDSIVLDFFSGSGTTAHAVMDINAEDGGNRQYIMVQIDEKIDEKTIAFNDGYRTIDEIGRKRIEIAAKQIKENTEANIDYGYKLYRLKSLDQLTVDKIVNFSTNLFPSYLVSNNFSKESILVTWLNQDGYGLGVNSNYIKLDTYRLDIYDRRAYIIDGEITSEDIRKLILMLENNKLEEISDIVIYPYLIKYERLSELKINLKNLRNRDVNLIERY